MKTSTKILITLIVWIAATAITWGEMALMLLVVKWIGVKFNFFNWSVLLTIIVMFFKGIFKSKSKSKSKKEKEFLP